MPVGLLEERTHLLVSLPPAWVTPMGAPLAGLLLLHHPFQYVSFLSACPRPGHSHGCPLADFLSASPWPGYSRGCSVCLALLLILPSAVCQSVPVHFKLNLNSKYIKLKLKTKL